MYNDAAPESLLNTRFSKDSACATFTICFKQLAKAIDDKDNDAIYAARKPLSDLLSKFHGDIHWRQVMEAIIPSQYHDSLACQQLNVSFVEILKNSLDAAISRRESFSNAPDSVTLTVKINTSITNKISISIIDNAGGMSDIALQRVARYCDSRVALADSLSSPSSNKKKGLHFGGAYLGMKILIAGIRYASVINDKSRLERKYQNPLQSELIFKNTTTSNAKGLEITITTPKEAVTLTARPASLAPICKLESRPSSPLFQRRKRRENSSLSPDATDTSQESALKLSI